MPRARSILAAAALLATAPLALLPTAASALPYGASLTQVQDDQDLQFQVEVYCVEGVLEAPRWFQVVRTRIVPEMSGAWPLTEWIEFPEPGGTASFILSDGAVAGLSAARYEVRALWEDAGDEVLEADWFALVEHPYLLRGTLLSPTELAPCTDTGLLECVEVELVDPAWWDEHGSSVMLDIYGWPTRLVNDTNCAVRVTWVEPMPPGSDCADPMPVERLAWSTMRTKFR